MKTIEVAAAPTLLAACAMNAGIRLYKASTTGEKVSKYPCPTGTSLLGYLLLRQGTEWIKDNYGFVTSNEILSKTQKEAGDPGKVLIINLLGESETVLKSYQGMKNAEIIS